MTTLTKGANTAVAATSVRAALTWMPAPGVPDVDISALLLDSTGKVRGDGDFVYYNAQQHASGAVAHIGKQMGSGGISSDTVSVDLASLEAGIERVVIAASADGGTFGQVAGLRLVLLDAATGAELARFEDMGASSETAFVAGELYRRAGAWKFRAIGQGWDSGLAGLATDFGISVDDEPAISVDDAPTISTPATPLAPSTPPAAAVVSPVVVSPVVVSPAVVSPAVVSTAVVSPVVVNLDKGRVSLRKGERVSLVKTGAPPLSEVVMGLGWDPAKRGKAIDLDASVIALDAAGKKLEIVWFMHLKEFGGAIRHTGDELTGGGDGDDERIIVRLADLPARVCGLVFTINSFRGQKFTDVRGAFCRLVDSTSRAELVRFDLTASEPRTGVVMAALTRTPAGPWEMRAVGTFHDSKTAKGMVAPAEQCLLG